MHRVTPERDLPLLTRLRGRAPACALLAWMLAFALLLLVPADLAHHVHHLKTEGHDEEDTHCLLCIAAHHSDSTARIELHLPVPPSASFAELLAAAGVAPREFAILAGSPRAPPVLPVQI